MKNKELIEYIKENNIEVTWVTSYYVRISLPYLRKICRGERLATISQLQRIADYLGINIEKIRN